MTTAVSAPIAPRRPAAVPVRRVITPRAPRSETLRANEAALVRIAQGDPTHRATRDAQAALLEADRGLLCRLVASYRGKGVSEDDLLQAACIGYLEGVRRFDVDSGYAVATYALWWARLEVQECLADGAVAYIPREMRMRVFGERGKRKHTDAARSLRKLLRPASLDAPLTRADGSRDTAIGETIPCRCSLPDAVAEEASTAARVTALLGDALATLAPRERDIVRRRLLADDPEALEDIGASHGITRERTRQLEAGALAKLRGHFARYATADDRATLELDLRHGPPVRVKAWNNGRATNVTEDRTGAPRRSA